MLNNTDIRVWTTEGEGFAMAWRRHRIPPLYSDIDFLYAVLLMLLMCCELVCLFWYLSNVHLGMWVHLCVDKWSWFSYVHMWFKFVDMRNWMCCFMCVYDLYCISDPYSINLCFAYLKDFFLLYWLIRLFYFLTLVNYQHPFHDCLDYVLYIFLEISISCANYSFH